MDSSRGLKDYSVRPRPTTHTQLSSPRQRDQRQRLRPSTRHAPHNLSAGTLAAMKRPTSKQMWRVLFAVLGGMAVITMVSPLVSGLLGNLTMQRYERKLAQEKSASSTAPALTIKPLSVRPVVTAFMTTPEKCPPSAPVAPDKPMRVCDLSKTAVYELGPESMRLDLMHVDSLRNPLTGVETVQMTMTQDSAQKFGEYTAGQVGKQLAFVRGGTVVWGPKITEPITGEMLQLSGDLSEEQARRVANMLRDDS